MANLEAYNKGNGPIGILNLSDADGIHNVYLSSAGVVSVDLTAFNFRAVMMRGDGAFYFKTDAAPVVPTSTTTSGSLYVPADTWEGDSWLARTSLTKPVSLQFIRATASTTIITLAFYND